MKTRKEELFFPHFTVHFIFLNNSVLITQIYTYIVHPYPYVCIYYVYTKTYKSSLPIRLKALKITNILPKYKAAFAELIYFMGKTSIVACMCLNQV